MGIDKKTGVGFLGLLGLLLSQGLGSGTAASLSQGIPMGPRRTSRIKSRRVKYRRGWSKAHQLCEHNRVRNQAIKRKSTSRLQKASRKANRR